MVNGHEKPFWSKSKRKPGENEQFKGRRSLLVCELSKEMAIWRDFGSKMFSLCDAAP